MQSFAGLQLPKAKRELIHVLIHGVSTSLALSTCNERQKGNYLKFCWVAAGACPPSIGGREGAFPSRFGVAKTNISHA